MIGIFDSGVGGLSVWRELIKVLPNEEYIYVADSGYCPYGPKSKEEVVERADAISKFLISKGVSSIVVACNTATAAAIEYLRANYNIPFIGMEPAVKPAALNSHSGVIGVLATAGTFNGELYNNTLHRFAADIEVIEQVGTGLVELVESGNIDGEEAFELLTKYLQPMINKGADAVVLGCTHYPFLIDTIKKIVGSTMEIINPAPAIARRALEINTPSLLRDNLAEMLSDKLAEPLSDKFAEPLIDNLIDNISNRLLSATFITTGNNILLIKDMVSRILNGELDNSNFITEVI